MKAEWAFKVFDFDGDNLLGKNDIWKVLNAITNSGGGRSRRSDLTTRRPQVWWRMFSMKLISTEQDIFL